MEQLGGAGTSIAELQMDLAHLETIKDIIRKKVDTGDKVDFEKIQAPLKLLVDELGEFAKKINENTEAKSDVNLNLILNQLSDIQQFVTKGEENYLDIKLKSMPRLVHPPIAIPSITESYTAILNFVDKSIRELVDAINSRNRENEAEFNDKLTKLIDTLAKLDEKTRTMNETKKLIETKIQEISNYTKIELRILPDQKISGYQTYLTSGGSIPSDTDLIDIRPDFFFPVLQAPNETISMEKLEEASVLAPGKLATDISERFDTVISDIKIDGETLVKPNYMKLKSGLLGGDNIYLHTKENVRNIMNEIFCRWNQKISQAKTKLVEKREGIRPLIESGSMISLIEDLKKTKLAELSANIEKLGQIVILVKSKNTEILNRTQYDCLLSNPEFNEILTRIDGLTLRINEFVGSLSDKLKTIQESTLTSSILSSIQHKKLVEEINKINSEIELNLKLVNDNLLVYKDYPDKFQSDCEKKIVAPVGDKPIAKPDDDKAIVEPVDNKASLEPIVDKINMAIQFINNLISIPDELLKLKFFERLVWDYNLTIKNIGPSDVRRADLLKASPKPELIRLINSLTIKQKVDLIGSFLGRFPNKELFESFKRVLNISTISTSLETSKLFEELSKSRIPLDIKLPKYEKNIYRQILNYMYDGNIPARLELSSVEAKRDFINRVRTKKAEFDSIKEAIESLKLVGGYSQTGGFIDSWEKYYNKIIEMFMKINEYKIDYNKFREVAREFNIKYIQLYNHQLYISNYIQIVLLGESYQVYQYISRGSINYYRGVVNSIKQKCDDAKTVETDPVIRYFYKYHYTTLELLQNFLNQLRLKWSVDKEFFKSMSLTTPTNDIAKNQNNSRLMVITNPPLIHTMQMKKGLFIFNLFKDILDSYTLNYSSPVAVYLRINDWNTINGVSQNPEVFKKDPVNPEKFLLDNLGLCDPSNRAFGSEIRKATPQKELDNLPKIIGDFNNIEFNEIFDPAGFDDNSTLAMYMNIPTYLAKEKSIMMITYGYSGVGKTFTLFGKAPTDASPEQKPGILQKALLAIQNKKAIYMRTYEIYGKALPYKSYWANLTADQYDHLIYTYNFGNESELEINEITGAPMIQYLQKIKLNNSDGYREITDGQINLFEKFIDKIDTKRKEEGRIKKTINNPDSSRSIMVYEFKVQIKSADGKPDKYVRFVVMDLPGKEDIKSSYVDLNKTDDELREDFCVKLKPQILKDFNSTNREIGNYYQPAVRAAIFLNPLFISIFPTIANRIYDYFITKNKIDIGEQDKFNITTINSAKTIDKNGPSDPKYDYLNIQLKLRKLIEDIEKETYPVTPTTNRYDDPSTKAPIEFNKKFRKCLVASEIMRYLLANNKITEIIDFYKSELLDVSDECNSKNSASLPFEGFYINENILGLVNTLRKRLKPTYQVESNKLMGDFFSENMGTKYVYQDLPIEKQIQLSTSDLLRKQKINLFKDEPIAQTYFIRNFIRQKIGSNYLISDDGSHLLSQTNNTSIDGLLSYGKVQYTAGDSGKTKSIKSWLEDSYDFNKSYTKEPPIATFMKAYFDTLDSDREDGGTNYVINNFYLFFVVSNERTYKCANQIKLVYDSREFIQSIKNYVPEDKPAEQPSLSALSTAASILKSKAEKARETVASRSRSGSLSGSDPSTFRASVSLDE